MRFPESVALPQSILERARFRGPSRPRIEPAARETQGQLPPESGNEKSGQAHVLASGSSVPNRRRSMTSIGVSREKSPSPRHSRRLSRWVVELLSYEELPEWYQDNEHIRTGYRPVSFSSRACFMSWMYLHNESFNIYSHLIASALYLSLQLVLSYLFYESFPNATTTDRAVFAFFLMTATVTFFLSSTFHTMMNHSMSLSHLFLRIDYGGILLLILGHFVSGIYVGFYCEPALQKVYWTMIVSLGTLTAILVLHPRLQGLKWRAFRALAFTGTGLSGFAPLGHGIIIYGFRYMWIASGMPYYLLEGLIFLIGVTFYTTRFPESIKPGKFDIFGSSHNYFHVLVVIATTVHLIGIWDAYAYQYEHRQCTKVF